LAAALSLALLAGCGPSPKPPGAAPPAASNATAAHLVAPQGADTAISPPMPDPDHDPRPDRAKAADFAAHLQRTQANMAAVDTDFIARVRTAMQAGAQADAAQLLADYRALIAADIAALPGAPHLAGCFARAAAPDAKAEAAVAAMLADRRDKADAVAAIADRPLSLPDFGGLATDIATGAGAADARASLAAAQAAIAGCRDTPAPQRPPPPAPGPPPPDQSHQRMSVQIITPPTPTPAAAPQPQAPPPKKPSLFQRMFGGG